MNDVPFGVLAKDVISGLEGVVTSKAFYLNGCHRVTLQPRTVKDGKPAKGVSFDIQQIKLLGAKPVLEAAPMRAMPRDLALGVKAQCLITGLKGVVTARADWVHGERVVCITPAAKDGALQEDVWAEVAHVKVLDARPLFEKATGKPGGPFAEPRSSCASCAE